MAIRQMLGHPNLPEFVGDIVAQALTGRNNRRPGDRLTRRRFLRSAPWWLRIWASISGMSCASVRSLAPALISMTTFQDRAARKTPPAASSLSESGRQAQQERRPSWLRLRWRSRFFHRKLDLGHGVGIGLAGSAAGILSGADVNLPDGAADTVAVSV